MRSGRFWIVNSIFRQRRIVLPIPMSPPPTISAMQR
jgi:hypothetical protein